MPHGFMYLVAIMDWYSRYVLAWRLSNTLDVDFRTSALEEALAKGTPEIFNTDQGSQFTSETFTGMLLGKKVGSLWGQRVEVVGGIVLCLIGVKILMDHLFA